MTDPEEVASDETVLEIRCASGGADHSRGASLAVFGMGTRVVLNLGQAATPESTRRLFKGH